MPAQASTKLRAFGIAALAALVVGGALLFASGLLLALAVAIPVGIVVLVAGALLFGKAEVHVIRDE